MVKIRLRRMGAKKAPFYRVVVADSRFARDGRFIEEIGYYDPTKEPSVVKIDAEKAQKWIKNGAQPTDTVKAACMDAVRTVPGVLSDPAPEVYLASYGASSIEYAVRCWTSVEDYWNAYYTLNEALRDAFDKHGVEMTYDHLNVHLVPESGKTEQQS